VATIPPITLIAGRTLIAGVLLLLIMRWRGVSMPTDGATWGRFAFQACLNSVVPWTLIAWGEGTVDAGLATILNSAAPIFTFLFTALVTRHEAASPRKLFGVIAGMAGICLIVGTTAQAYLRVPIGVAISVIFLGERLSPTAWLGLACVVVGVAAMTWPARSAAALKTS